MDLRNNNTDFDGDYQTQTNTTVPYDESSDILYTIRIMTDTFVKMSICILGTGANIINIIIFAQIGLKDSVTVSFFGLAIADLGNVIFTFSYQLCETLDQVTGFKPEVNLDYMSRVLNIYTYYFIDVSVLITVYTAIQKCACVALPFLFKDIFTRKISAIVVMCMFAFMFGYYMPLFVERNLRLKWDTTSNRTRYIAPYFAEGKSSKNLYIFNRVTIPFVAVVLVLTNMIIMRVKLVQASRMRYTMTQKNEDEPKDGEKVKNKNYLNSNELKALEAVLFVSAIFVSCYIPDLISLLVEVVYPEFSYSGKYSLASRMTRAVQNSLSATNATVNILVYIKYNSKYRKQFLMIFGRCCCGKCSGK